jgi:hypothetical protein
MEELKVCTKCDVEKPISEFRERQPTKSGKRSWEGACKRCRYEQAKKNPNRQKVAQRFRESEAARRNTLARYGLTPKQYEEMIDACNGLCEICGRPETKLYAGKPRHLSIDHCHDSMKVRGLLCDACNNALGRVNDDIEILKSMIKYLEERA